MDNLSACQVPAPYSASLVSVVSVEPEMGNTVIGSGNCTGGVGGARLKLITGGKAVEVWRISSEYLSL